MFYLFVFLNASRNFPEFAGCFGKVFPGQEPPRTPRILPREVLMPKRFKANLIDIKLAKRHLQRMKYSGVLVPEVFTPSEDNTSYTCENGQIQNVFLSEETSSCEVAPNVIDERKCCGLPEVEC